MSGVLEELAALTERDREEFWSTLSRQERVIWDDLLNKAMGSKYAGWRYDPIGFVNQCLGEPTWSKMEAILDSVLKYKITCVPAGHSVSKSHTAARVVAWWTSVHPPGTALVITTATTFQQVKTILWPHIRRMQARHKLPGRTNTTEWIVPMPEDAGEFLAAYGFSSSDNDESAVQGRHAPHLLIVVDEAGGISHEMGKALYSLLTGGHTRMLLIGNPSTEEENTWFQKRCESGRANTNVVRIAVGDTPNFSGETAGFQDCTSCPAGVPPHPIASHLVDKAWYNEVIDEFGADSAYVEARVHARFPSMVADKVIPLTWLEMAEAKAWPDEEVVPARIMLGVDVASDGGDEFVIARRTGWYAEIVHAIAGAANENSEDVADEVFKWIVKAEAQHEEWGITETVRVKIDEIGVGWGVVSNLKKRRERGEIRADIIGVNVSERAGNDTKFDKIRAEMWWNLRTLLQPKRVEQPIGGGAVAKLYEYTGPVRLDIDTRTLAQLSAPQYRPDSSGRVTIEKKTEIKKRTGGRSPDRGEAILLAFYEPPQAVSLGAFTPAAVGKAAQSWRQVATPDR
jgi:hypothetical protein